MDRTPRVAYLSFATLGRRNRFVTTVNHRRLVKAGVFQQTVRSRQAPLRARLSSCCRLAGTGANPNICGAAFACARLERSQTSQADYESPGRMKPKQMIPPSDWIFIPSYLILSADFELKRPPTGGRLCSQSASLFNGELRWRKVKCVATVKPRSRKRRSRRSPSPPPRS